ncbi:hypothetical protein [Paenibacillus sp. GM2]|uniref:hypothetical protein n=1 Tax=Paenibacillus sp. GM2 TaxID=1622070 RepID=UPI000839CD78|nr:hypothetical protein [Paenibacillus sp. GM2]
MRASISICFLVVVLLTACNNRLTESVRPQNTNGKAEILEVTTDLTKNAGWWVVPEDATTMTIHVKAKNIETVLFWIAPAGTETWGERELIGYDIEEDNGWSLTWNFGSRAFHDRIYIQALGSDGTTQDNETMGVTSE